MTDLWIAVADVVLAAGMLYYVYTWLVRTRSAAIVVGLLALTLLYFGANTLGLHLTTRILQGFYTVALLAIIIIFQPELRRILENVGFIGGRGGADAAAPPAIRAVAESMFDLAAQRIGALVVLRGVGPIARHLTGGIPLDAEISPQLLGSIFDPHSPGHDGAVIVAGDRLTQFGCYLPLTKQHNLNPQYGTRHRSAIGISEATDALAIVVSEESGDVAAARDGRLVPQTDVAMLEGTMQEFVRGGTPATRRRAAWLRPFVHRPFAKAGALVVAAALWFITGVQREPTMRAQVMTPILYEHLADALYIASDMPEAAQAELEGPPETIAALRNAAPALVMNLDGLAPGTHVVPITAANFQLPDGVRLLDADPSALEIRVEAFRTTTVPVTVQVKGKPAEGYRVGQVRAEPAAVRVMHKADALPEALTIVTEPVLVDEVRKDMEVQVALVWPTGVHAAADQPEEVTAFIVLHEIAAPPIAGGPGPAIVSPRTP